MSKTLYHYCSSQTAFSIFQTRTLRLSALSSANDTLEGRIVSRVFSELLAKSSLPKGVADVASVIVAGYAETTEGFALCLSEEGDLLSQWRAYASDGAGLSIGFSGEDLIEDCGPINFGGRFYELTRVEYGEEPLRTNLLPLIAALEAEFVADGDFISLVEGYSRQDAILALASRSAEPPRVFKGNDTRAPKRLNDLLEILRPIGSNIFDTKHQSFFEEKEWRLLRFSHRDHLSVIKYFVNSNSIRPFVECNMNDDSKKAIREVILGPKHPSNLDWVTAFLKSCGMEHVSVRRSRIQSYR